MGYTGRPQTSMSNRSLDRLLTRLEAAKSCFGPGQAARTAKLLARLAPAKFRDPKLLLRFHEVLLFLRAFPQSARLVPQIETLLNSFHRRIGKLREAGADMEAFDDF